MKQKNEHKKSRGGRIPLADPAKNRHVFYLNDVDELRFDKLLHQSEAKNGKKINDSFEKRRSEHIRRELEEKYNLIPAEKQKQANDLPLKPVDLKAGNIKKQVSNIAKSLMKEYRFQSTAEYRALLHLYGVTVEEVKGEVRGKAYNGLVYSALDKKGEKTILFESH